MWVGFLRNKPSSANPPHLLQDLFGLDVVQRIESQNMKKPKILLVDDDPLFNQTTEQQLSELGFDSVAVQDGTSGDQQYRLEEYALVLLDLRLPDTDGLTLLKSWQKKGLKAPIVMISGKGTIPEAVDALKCGAVDFLVKPVDINLLQVVINRTLASQKLKSENTFLKELTHPAKIEFLGESRVVTELLNMARKIASSDHPVLLEGETGTGKQVLAHYICSQSDRVKEPFVQVNCAAITPTLFESELFGHEKGAFTGAHTRKIGKLELVGKGTLFLDEIGELPPECQAKLLTAVEDRTYARVGGTMILRFEGRIIAATNRNLESEVANGNFRKDLFYRLNTFRQKLPPLREHVEDIPIYIKHTLEKCGRKYGCIYEQPDSDIVDRLKKYGWPGNVRELVHHIERITLFADGRKIRKRLWLTLPLLSPDTADVIEADLQNALESFKKQHILKVLADCGGNQTVAAKHLGIGRTYLNRLLVNYKNQK